MVDTQTSTATEPEVICNHKPGEVWADGCCTSKKNKQPLPENTFDTEVSKDAAAENQARDLNKDS